MSEFIEDILEMAERLSKAPSKSRLRAAQAFLDLACQDLKSSKLNYDGKIFNFAAYHLQQAVEKTAKAYHKLLGVLDDRAIRKTGHDSPELFLRIVELPWAQEFGKLVREFSGVDFVIDTSEAQSVIDTDAKKAEIARLDTGQINGLLSSIPKIEGKLVPLFAVVNKDFVMASLRLYLLSALTFPHEGYSRYADGVVKPVEYTPDLGIVAAMATIWVETDAAISEVQRLIDSPNEKRFMFPTLE